MSLPHATKIFGQFAREARAALCAPFPPKEDPTLRTESMTWNVYALFNHDLGQIYIGASDAPKHALPRHCAEESKQLQEWSPTAHRIDWMESVEGFRTHREARAYAKWLHREGAFEGTEDFTMGLQTSLA